MNKNSSPDQTTESIITVEKAASRKSSKKKKSKVASIFGREKKALAKKMNMRSFPRFVLAQPLVLGSSEAGLFFRLPHQHESEYDISENLFLLSDEIFEPKEEYIKGRYGSHIHPSLWHIIQQQFSADLTAKDALLLCIEFLMAWREINTPRYEYIPSTVYNKAA